MQQIVTMALPQIQDQTAEDIVAAAGYPAVRAAFNETLAFCTERLSKADWHMASKILGFPEELWAGSEDFLTDTALYSRPGAPIARMGRQRAIDRLARKLPTRGNPLMARIAERLPAAFFSVFKVEDRDERRGRVAAKDLLDGRRFTIADEGLARSARPGTTFAGRFADLGPWHVGFGIVIPMKRSEAAALLVALSHTGDVSAKRDSLHELVYGCRLHDDDLVMTALEPFILAMSMIIDTSDADVDDIVAEFTSLLQEPE